MRNKLLVILTVILFLALGIWLGINFFGEKTEVSKIKKTSVADEPVVYWAERDTITDFVGRVSWIKDNELKILTYPVNGKEFEVAVIITEETEIIKALIDDSGDFPKKVKEPGNLEEIRTGVEIIVRSDEDIRKQSSVTAYQMEFLLGSEEALEGEEEWILEEEIENLP